MQTVVVIVYAVIPEVVVNGGANKYMLKKTSQTALCAIMAGLSLTLMLSTAIIPFMSYAIPALCGMLMLVIVIECNKKWALLVYMCVSILSLIIIPDKSAGLAYVLIFGYYPILKSTLENKFPTWLSYLLKLLTFNIVLLSSFYFMLYFFGIDTDGIEWITPYLTKWIIAPIIIIFASIFLLMYDTVLTRLVVIYKRKLRKKIIKTLK